MPRAYPELFAVLGGSVPDFRGLFLRGVGGNAAPLGSAQGDAIRNIYGELAGVADNPSLGGVYATGPFRLNGNWYRGTGIEDTDNAMVSFDASLVVPTANENRPVNKAVRYLIRAKP